MDIIFLWNVTSSSLVERSRRFHLTSYLSLFISKVGVEKFLRNVFFLIGIVGGGVQLGALGPAAINRPIVPAPGDYDNGESGGMGGRRNRSTRRKPSPVPLCPPQTPHAAWTRTRTATVGSQRLITWATARLSSETLEKFYQATRFFIL
jgi:hypothetical protein